MRWLCYQFFSLFHNISSRHMCWDLWQVCFYWSRVIRDLSAPSEVHWYETGSFVSSLHEFLLEKHFHSQHSCSMNGKQSARFAKIFLGSWSKLVSWSPRRRHFLMTHKVQSTLMENAHMRILHDIKFSCCCFHFFDKPVLQWNNMNILEVLKFTLGEKYHLMIQHKIT